LKKHCVLFYFLFYLFSYMRESISVTRSLAVSHGFPFLFLTSSYLVDPFIKMLPYFKGLHRFIAFKKMYVLIPPHPSAETTDLPERIYRHIRFKPTKKMGKLIK